MRWWAAGAVTGSRLVYRPVPAAADASGGGDGALFDVLDDPRPWPPVRRGAHTDTQEVLLDHLLAYWGPDRHRVMVDVGAAAEG